ncbi:hypothetical protein IE53DRAFT_57150 [Violaceomyces palustris]|uniref:Uncharacterized protein n=1 Tax=Violaceomyces palustris TaxID=1673888 RepID=A0ACD0NZN3_9BASI|nr:hypothetical protein IE53DRAFT_57150 [Violaceomyces palustris]
MANPRQRRKAKSSSHTKPSSSAKRHAKKKLARAPTVKGPEVLKQAWDGKLTVRQNYAKLGLLPTLSGHQSGGLAPTDPYYVSRTSGPSPNSELSSHPRKGMARILRDEEGNVVEVQEAEEAEEETAWGKPLSDWDSREKVDDEEAMMPKRLIPRDGQAEVVEALSNLASTAEPVTRHASDAEKDWLRVLVDKYNDDYDAMAKDRSRNVWQKTSGEIRRAIKKAGGVESLRK